MLLLLCISSVRWKKVWSPAPCPSSKLTLKVTIWTFCSFSRFANPPVPPCIGSDIGDAFLDSLRGVWCKNSVSIKTKHIKKLVDHCLLQSNFTQYTYLYLYGFEVIRSFRNLTAVSEGLPVKFQSDMITLTLGVAASILGEILHITSLKWSPSSAAYIRQWTGSALVQVMACRLFGAKASNVPVATHCQLELAFENVVCEMAVGLFKGRWVEAIRRVTRTPTWTHLSIASSMSPWSKCYKNDMLLWRRKCCLHAVWKLRQQEYS